MEETDNDSFSTLIMFTGHFEKVTKDLMIPENQQQWTKKTIFTHSCVSLVVLIAVGYNG